MMTDRYTPRLCLALACCLLGELARAAEFQWAVDMEGKDRRAYLWIPPKCERVRGVILTVQNLLEKPMVEDPVFRSAAADAGFAIVWINPAGFEDKSPLAGEFKYRDGAGRTLDKLLADLAAESGYAEIATAPLMPMGHSAAGPLSWQVAYWRPDRVIACVAIKTTFPGPPGWDPQANIEGVPLVYVTGQCTEWPEASRNRERHWHGVRDAMVKMRERSDRHLMSVVVEPGGGHFEWSPAMARYIGLYIRKAAKYRIGADGELRLLRLEDGWLTDTSMLEPSRFAPAAYSAYRGAKTQAFWHFDEEEARAAEAFCGDRNPRELQMVTFMEDGRPINGAKQGFAPMRFAPADDGVTFHVEGGFLSEVPEQLINAGTKLGHAPGPVRIRMITGSAIQTAANTLRVKFDREGFTSRACTLWMLAEHDGDDVYRKNVQPGRIMLPTCNSQGKPQTLTFAPIADVKPGTKTIPLKAESDSGLPVDFYVISGPAEADGPRLKFSDIPPRARLPMKVRVVAYQWGLPGRIQSADPVERVFEIEK
ncbi:MAG: hypothetical protein ACHRHE_18285 [Tepidisphaerales bacterium]